MTPSMDQMTVFVDGKPVLREVYSVTFRDSGQPVRTPVLADDEEMRATVDGQVHIFKVQKPNPSLVTELRYIPVGPSDCEKFIVGYADGSEHATSRDVWMGLRDEMERRYD